MEGWFDAFVGGMVSMTFGDAPPKMAGFAASWGQKKAYGQLPAL